MCLSARIVVLGPSILSRSFVAAPLRTRPAAKGTSAEAEHGDATMNEAMALAKFFAGGAVGRYEVAGGGAAPGFC